jgi:hypothetical protein
MLLFGGAIAAGLANPATPRQHPGHGNQQATDGLNIY